MHTEIEVPNAKYLLVPGMYATVKIPLHKVHDVLMAPVQAVESTGKRGKVLVVESNRKIARREVTLGVQSASNAEVLYGLREEDTVVYGEQPNSSQASS